jgi:hypothetical protein
MSRSPATVLVHVAQIATGADPSAIERMLAAEHGVVGASMSPHVRSLAIVDYDPRVVSATAIQRSIEARGLTARLVGM